MHLRLILAAALAVGLSSAVQAQTARTVATCGAQSLRVGDATNLFVDSTGILCSTAGSAGGGAGSTGSVTAPGTNGTQAQAIQGINGGVPVPVTGSLASAPAVGAQEQDLRSTQTLNAATLNAAVTVPVNGQGTLGFALNGLTASGATLTFEQSEDGGTTWTIVNEVNAGTGVATSTRSTDGQTRIATSGRTNIRFRVSTVGTGTITVAYSLSVREGMIALTTPLPPGANTIGAIANTAFGISGTLPAFASTPTFNVGTTNGLALDATIIARLGTLGQKASAGSAPVVIASDQSAIPVGGTVTANLGTLNGAATAANQNATAAGTSATSAQAVQGVTGGVPQNVANAGTFAVQNTAAVVGGNATAVKTDSSATTQPVSAAALPLPSGAATSANQTSEIAAIQARQVSYTEAANASIAASGNTTITPRASTAAYTKFNATAGCDSANATLIVQGSNDSFTSWVPLATSTVPTGSRNAAVAGTTVSAPVNFAAYRAYVQQTSANANVCTVVTSYTAN